MDLDPPRLSRFTWNSSGLLNWQPDHPCYAHDHTQASVIFYNRIAMLLETLSFPLILISLTVP